MKEEHLQELRKPDEVAALYKCLGTFNLDQLLGALFEFIETYVKYSSDERLNWP